MKPRKSPGFLAGIFLVLFSTAILTGAEVKDEKAPTPPKKWSLAIKGGLTLNAGNTDSRLLTGGFNFNLKLKGFEYLSHFEIFNGTGSDQVILDKGKWDNKITLTSPRRLNLYGTMSMEYDKFALIAFRGNAGLGLRYNLARSPKTTSYLAAGFSGEFTDVFDAWIEVTDIDSLRFNLYYTLDKTFSATGKYLLEALYTSNFKHFFTDYRVELKAALSLTIKKPFSLKVEIQDKFTNHPLEVNLEKNDFILVTALEISL